MTDHVSDLKWDQMTAGELTAAQRDAIEEHAKDCERCSARFRELAADREAFKFRPAPKLGTPKRNLRWTMPIAGVLAVAAIAVLVLRPGRTTDDDGYTGIKGAGAPELLLFAGSPDQLGEVATGGKIFAGDAVQAGYTSKIDGYGAVLSLDGARNASAYVPAVGGTMVVLPAGERRSFPASTQLDDVLGNERIMVLWCANALPIAPLVDELQRTGTLAAREGCVARAYDVDKAMR